MPNVTYHMNNSGGFDWLDKNDWSALRRADWTIEWRPFGLPTTATKDFPSVLDAIENWTLATGLDPDARGCSCCGPPHNFYTT